MTATERRNLILRRLSARRQDKIANLACEFGVTTRTIKTDLEILSLEAPIYTVQGNGGGVFVQDGWYVSKVYLTDKQEELLQSLMPGLQPEQRAVMENILSTFANPKKGTRI